MDIISTRLRARVDGVAPEGGAVAQPPVEHRRLARDELDHLAHGHARREAVRVHDHVGAPALLAEGHVLLVDDQPHHAAWTQVAVTILASDPAILLY